ncbi:MAG: chromosomal replication initiator protein DnaA [Clostridiaceae bacterium]|jgi:chromosomal replication initiator protein|nr:chromosomal replication initiator protein DnaA [Clostridiaceae bacterium]
MVNIDYLWKDALNLLSARIQAIGYEVWVAKLEPVCFIKNSLILATNSPMSKKTIENRYLEAIKEAVHEVHPTVSDVEIITDDKKEDYLKKQDGVLEDAGFVIKTETSSKPEFSFSKKYTFDSFVVGTSNNIAAAAAQAVAENPGTKINPLFIYGGVGLGKTHLMHAIGNYLNKVSPQIKVLYVTTNSFINELIDVIRNGRDINLNREFHEKYRAVDVLMMDDVQFTSSKTAVQEALFNVFNDLHQNGKQIVLSSDRPPKEIESLEERLRTRFAWGIMADIKPPSLEMRIAILEEKAKEQNFLLSPEVSHFIAENNYSNVRDMEGMLNKVIFYSSLSGSPVASVETAREALKDIIDNPRESIDENDIIYFVCKYFNVSIADVKGKKKTKEIVEPRMIAIYLITEMLSLPLVTIGHLFGNRDHTTVMHARDKISKDIKINPKLRLQVDDIKKMVLKK